MIKEGKTMVVIDTEYNFLYDKDERTGKLSKVLRCFHNDDLVTFNMFSYADNNTHREPTEKEVEMLQCTYYLEDGSRPLKTRDCKKCKDSEECCHNQKYYNN
jgi:hypothetical protein